MYLFASSGFNLLEVNPGLVIWTLITFLIVVWVLKKFAWDLIINSLDQRANTIQSDIDRSEKLKKESQAIFEEYQAKMQSVKKQADSILDEARQRAEALKNNIVKKANQESETIKKNLSKEIEIAKERAIEDIKTSSIDFCVSISEKILEKEIEKNQKEFIQSQLKILSNIQVK